MVPLACLPVACPVGLCKICVFVFVSLTLVNIPFILEHDSLNPFISTFTIFISYSTPKPFTRTTFNLSNLCPGLLGFTKARLSARDCLYSPSPLLCDSQAMQYVGKVTNLGCRVIVKYMSYSECVISPEKVLRVP